MQRWFFADEEEVCRIYKEPTPVPSTSTIPEVQEVPSVIYERIWRFCVKIHQKLCENESVALTGQLDSLGKWQLSQCVLLYRTNTPGMWESQPLVIPRYKPTMYRYLIVAMDPREDTVIVRSWETHLRARIVPPQIMSAETDLPRCDVFGCSQDVRHVTRGWLSCETYVQLSFVQAPFIWNPTIKARLCHIKITPLYLGVVKDCMEDSLVGDAYSNFSMQKDFSSEDVSSSDQSNISTAYAFCEAASLMSKNCAFKKQPQWGVPCSIGDIIIFHLTLGDFDNTAYMIDFYTYSLKAASDEPPYHFGYHLLQPKQMFKQSRGRLRVTITCATKHQPLGVAQFNYLVIRPTVPQLKQDMCTSFARYWNPEYVGLHAGHRGCGPTFVNYNGIVRENTLYSLKRAAFVGADILEFDVHLTKDLVPVLYHEFFIFVASGSGEPMHKGCFNKLPVSGFTIAELRRLRVSRYGEGYYYLHECPVEGGARERQPFPELAEVFDAIDQSVGFIIDLKWTQELADKTMESSFRHQMDPNEFVDALLMVVYRHHQRHIYLTCFDADICAMLRYKQNRYPVIQCIKGCLANSKPYLDFRVRSFETVIRLVAANELLGICAPSCEVLNCPTQMTKIKDASLVLFTWGPENENDDNRKVLTEMNVSVLIYDHIDSLIPKAIPKSVFGKRNLNATEDTDLHTCRTQVHEKKKIKSHRMAPAETQSVAVKNNAEEVKNVEERKVEKAKKKLKPCKKHSRCNKCQL